MSPVDLTLVVVHYHTPELACSAVDGLLRQARAESIALEIVVVDNGSDDRGRTALLSLTQPPSVRLLEPGRNLGYAGAANLGLREARGVALGVMNPDVVILPGCLRALLDQLAADADVAGPLFSWDLDKRMLIPPAEPRGRLVELLYTLGRRPGIAPLARRHWRRHARRHWLARDSLPSFDLIGALLVFLSSAYQTVGGFDEGYQLYFEETDWLARAREANRRSRYVPGAAAVHLFDQSASREPRASQWFAESSARFRQGHYGSAWSSLLSRLEGLPPRSAPTAPIGWPTVSADLQEGDYWFEVSPFAHGYPAAAELWTGDPMEWRLPNEISERHGPRPLYLRIVTPTGSERGCFQLSLSGGLPAP